MGEFGETPEGIEKQLHPTPRGETLLGSVDPRTLSRDEFMKSPDLLWHGSANDFMYDPELKISPEDNGMTAGYGFYLTESEEEARVFSLARLRDEAADQSRTVVKAFLPDHARMYDFRTQEGDENAPVPQTMIDEYSKFFGDYIARRFAQSSPDDVMTAYVHEFYLNYQQALERYRVSGKPMDLRSLLDTDGNGSQPFFGAVKTYTDFMLKEGFDGIILREGGDIPEQINRAPTSFVFYNLKKIGTYENYHPEVASQN